MASNMNPDLYRRRRLVNAWGMATSMAAMALGLAVLLWILVVLFSNGFAALDWNILTRDTPAPGTEGGGLRNAIVGSAMMVGLAVLVATPVGIFAGIYLTEFGDQSKTASPRAMAAIEVAMPQALARRRRRYRSGFILLAISKPLGLFGATDHELGQGQHHEGDGKQQDAQGEQ